MLYVYTTAVAHYEACAIFVSLLLECGRQSTRQIHVTYYTVAWNAITWNAITEAFPMGYGLDYLNVSYTNSSVKVVAQNPLDTITLRVSVSLSNVGGLMAGQFVVQVYFTPPPSVKTRLTRYRYQLGGFTKVHVPADGEAEAIVEIPRSNLQHWNPKTQEFVLDPRVYSIFVCHDTRGLGGSSTTKEIELPTGHPAGPCLSHSVTL